MRNNLGSVFVVLVFAVGLFEGFKVQVRAPGCRETFSEVEEIPGKCFHLSDKTFFEMKRARKYCTKK